MAKPTPLSDYTLLEQGIIVDELNKILEKHKHESYSNFIYKYEWKEGMYSKNIYFYVPFLNKFFFVSTEHLLGDLKFYNQYESVKDRLLNYSKNQIFSLDEPYDWSFGYYSNFTRESIIYDEIIDKFKEENPYSAVSDYENLIIKKREPQMYSRRYYSYDEPMNVHLFTYAITYLSYPQIEKLLKSGMEDIVIGWVRSPNILYARNFKEGNNLSEITKLPKYAWQLLKDETFDINYWNELRIFVQKNNLSKDQLTTVLNLGIRDTSTLKTIRSLLNYQFEEKNLYTLDSLLNYLSRVDMYQAIGTNDAITILRDYIRMSLQCGVEPLTNSNSLKREHDVVMRQYNVLLQTKREEFQNSLGDIFQERGELLSKYEYKNEELFVKSPKQIFDLIQEGNQNRNCVGSYIERFAKGNSNIFFIRKNEHPEDSYITIELNSNCTSIKQAFYSSNREITKPSDLQFINNWLEHNKNIDKNVIVDKDKDEEKDITDDMF